MTINAALPDQHLRSFRSETIIALMQNSIVRRLVM
ncbi:hypothetical protein PC129_g18002 [Phytophthora cactorum]|uniref:Uncharacterized protein n=1 Tax=Phytophthora cactorum TaxID=29920 RepID=A0A329S6W0_9STRA|nr:hypothetical protein Pcac1_g4295 [Phytophthora cactorum]KAG3057821.1 hypothetical protein PI125_g25334 [Phytophthora idaei]KAG2803042.1 hypothetical protein PC112_g19352 [Phytophthora cactorum]KAG2807601.1 hypothetical protein PC111_g16864 [Phytophthora cactorum]KAG2840401.1 hypothetical protein PC113_g19265 [Phytophthora cactorum]